MEKGLTAIKATVTGVIAILTAFWGWFGWMLVIWILLMLVDWITGSWGASKNSDWSSQRARRGIWHKCGMFVVFLVSAAVDWLIGAMLEHIPTVNLPFEYSVFLCVLVVCWYMVTEVGSIFENLSILGVTIPPFMNKILAIMNAKIEKVGDIVPDETEVTESKPGR